MRIEAPLREMSVNPENVREEWFVCERQVSPEPEVCPCGKTGIRELCWIQNRLTGGRIFIGNCCIGFLAERGFCARCRIYPVLSAAAHYCSACAHNRADKPSGFVEKGKPRYGRPIIGLSYEDAVDANPSYAKYIVATPSQRKHNDPHYLQFLLLWRSRARGVSLENES